MSFSNPITGGQGALIRPAIKSPNYVPGASGWTINRDGTAEFSSITIRGDLTSSNYVPGVSGYHLDYVSGSAEFNDASIRGRFEAADETVVITDLGILEFYSGQPNEQVPAQIQSGAGIDNQSVLIIRSNDDYAGDTVVLLAAPPQSAGGVQSGWYVYRDGVSIFGVASIFEISDDFVFRLLRTNDVSPSSSNHAFQIGASSGTNLRADNNEIMCVNNGVTATLNLQNDGGLTHMGGACDIDGSLTTDNMETGSFTAAATPGGAGGTSATVVNFGRTFANTPRVFLTPRVTTAGAAALRMFGVTGTSTTQFTTNINRTDLNTTVFDYLAICDMG